MPPRGRKPQVKDTLQRPRQRVRKEDAAAWVDELIELLRRVDRRADDLSSTEPYVVLEYAQRHHRALDEPSRARAAVLRAQVAQFIREHMDSVQHRAIEDGRELQVPWSSFHRALGVRSDNGAYNAARRLKAEALRTLGQPRTPEMAKELERRAREEELLAAKAVADSVTRHLAVRSAAQALLQHRGDLALDGSEEGSWSDHLAQLVDDCPTPQAQASLAACLRMVLEEVDGQASGRGVPAARTSAAAAALVAAAAALS